MKKKIISILFALLITLTLCIMVSADSIEWSISDDFKTLMVGDEVYELYTGYISPTDSFVPEKSFIYDETGNYYQYLKRNTNSSDILVIADYYYEEIGSIYVNENGKAILNEFSKGNYSNYKIVNEYFSEYATTSKSWIDNLDGGAITTIDVRTLANCELTYIVGCDSTGTIGHTIGAIYDRNGTYYFVNYDKLSNNYFDANGNLSYRQGEVPAYKLNVAQSSDMVEFSSNLVELDKTFEGDDSAFDGFGRGFYVTVFVIVTVIFGFIIPLIPVIIGAIRVTKGKTKNPKRWYLLFVGCALWIILAICFILALIF